MRAHKSFLPLALLATCLATRDAHSDWNPDGNRVSLSDGTVLEVAAVSNGAGGVFVAWVDVQYDGAGVTSRVYLQSLDAEGEVVAGWPVGGLELSRETVSSMSLASDGLGGAYVSWRTGTSLTELRLQRVGAKGAPAPGWPEGGMTVAQSVVPPAKLASDGTGGVLVGWIQYVGPTLPQKQRVIRVLGDAAVAAGWPAAGIDLAPTRGWTVPAVATKGAGGALVGWLEHLPEINRSRLRVHHVQPDGVFDPAWPPGGTSLSEYPGLIAGLTLVPDRGGAFAAWGGEPYFCLDALCADCYCPSDQIVSHIDAQGSGAGWPSEGRRLGDFGKVSTAPEGGLVALTIRPATAPDLADAPPRLGPSDRYDAAFVTRLEADGSTSPGWTHRGIVSTEVRNPTGGDAVSDGQGGVFATWIDHRTGNSVIYGTRLSASGAIASGWHEFGSLVAPAALYPYSPVLVASGEGAIVVWLEMRTRTQQVWADRLVPGPPGSPAPLAAVPAGLAGFGIRRVWPNPSREGFDVTIELPEAAPATLEIYDLAGRVVGSERFDFPSAARGSVSLNRDRVLEPGIYWLRLRQGPRMASQRIIVIR